MKFNLDERIKVATGIRANAGSAATRTGTGVSRVGYDECLVLFDVGVAGAGGTLALTIEESDDDSTYAPITDAAKSTTDATDDKVYVGRIDLAAARKKYLRAVVVAAVADVPHSVTFLFGSRVILPVSQENAVAFSV